MEMGKWKKNIHLHNRKSEDEVWDWYIFLRNWIFKNMYRKISSVQFSRSVVSNSLWPHELQHARSPCPSPTPGVEFTKLMSIESVMPSNHLTLCWPFLLLPSIFLSIRDFSKLLDCPIMNIRFLFLGGGWLSRFLVLPLDFCHKASNPESFRYSLGKSEGW